MTMKKITEKDFNVVLELINHYDLHIEYIDDFHQYRQAELGNKTIEKEVSRMIPEFTSLDIEKIKEYPYYERRHKLIHVLHDHSYEIEWNNAKEVKQEPKKEKKKRVWTEKEILYFIKTNDKVMYNALLKLYDCQTADEQIEGNAKVDNGIGFNGFDAPILTSFAEFLKKTGFLTPKQRNLCRKKLVKYRRQLVTLANM